MDKITIVIERDGEGYIAKVQEFDCVGHGDDLMDCIDAIKDSYLDLYSELVKTHDSELGIDLAKLKHELLAFSNKKETK